MGLPTASRARLCRAIVLESIARNPDDRFMKSPGHLNLVLQFLKLHALTTSSTKLIDRLWRIEMTRNWAMAWISAATIVLVTLAGSVAISFPATAATPSSIFGSETPALASDADINSVELGIQFKSRVAGDVAGIRFYKGTNNTGTHTASLWSGSKRVATATFAGESASGWQIVNFVTPMHIAAGTVYTASYLAPRGRYAVNDPYKFPHNNGDLTALRGTYRYGGGYPSTVYQASNYWVDILFAPTFATTSAPTSATTAPTTSSTLATTTVPTPPSNTPTTSPPTTIKTTAPSTIGTTPTNTQSTSSTTTTTQKQTLSCAIKPSLCGYPDATNTGVPAGTVMRRVPQDITSGPGWFWDTRFGGFASTNADGAVLDGLDVTGSIDVNNNNVTIRNSRFISSGEGNVINLKNTDHATIDSVTIATPPGTTGSNRLQVGIKDVYGDNTNTVIKRSNISGWCNGVQTHEGVLEDNYIHDPIYGPGDHTNGFTSNASDTPLLIRHNTIFNDQYQTDAISLFQDFGSQAYATVDNNLVAGGGYTIYAGGGGFGVSHDIHITNNRFSRMYFPASGGYGPYTAFDTGGAGNIWAGNVWDDSGLPVN